MSAPKCRYCRAALAPYLESKTVMIRTPHAFLEGETEISSREEKVATGRFGFAGDGTFCSMRCGYVYGHRAAHGRPRTRPAGLPPVAPEDEPTEDEEDA